MRKVRARILPAHREWLQARFDPERIEGFQFFLPDTIVEITREPHEGFYEAWDQGQSIIIPKRFIEFIELPEADKP